MPSNQNERALHLRSLHMPGDPLLLMNVYDPPSARAVASLANCKALATASYAIAEAAGLKDEELDFETNLRAVKLIAKISDEFDKPLTVDLQGGYGDRLEECVRQIIRAGAVGCNLEDVGPDGKLYDIQTAAERVERALKVAAACNVPDFVINARSDVILFGGDPNDAIARGRRYLEAGAANIFVWGGRNRGGITREEVVELTRGLQGKLNVSMKIGQGNLTVQELSEIGVARISIGPQLHMFAMEALKEKAGELLA